MLRYALDSLGWYEFEGLIQSLLKARLGLGIEAWGGSGDWGRDAYFDGQLTYPADKTESGPFVFQCKFIDGANAAGAKTKRLLIAAVKKESERIRLRLKPSRRSRAATPVWTQPPSVYSLLTNAPIDGATRTEIEKVIRSVLPSSKLHAHSGQDVCAWLDLSPEVVRAFPQLWALRDIDELLRLWVHADILNRSRAALSESRDIARIFVPTTPYSRALEVLSKHYFVVLEGPPEMGKTAIGRTISLSAVARGWEAIECRGPVDMERAYTQDAQQVFVADDFFGRTEYDPRLVSNWQRELPHLLRLLDARHWLILTTRAHLLNLAKPVLDIGGSAGKKFPTAGEVVVDASDLSHLEKARILYRHLKSTGLPESVRKLFRESARSVVYNSHFTPERIRRLVSERIPTLIKSTSQPPNRDEIMSVVTEALNDPTHAMQVSFKNLAPEQKWLLFSFIETELSFSALGSRFSALASKEENLLAQAYERLCPIELREPFEDVLSALSQAFVKKSESSLNISWVHPSCRDLAISELSRDPRYRLRFLQFCSIEGIQLAVSIGGGSRGRVSFPLLQSDEDWAALKKRAVDDQSDQLEVLHALSEGYEIACSASTPDIQIKMERLRKLLADTLWPQTIERLNTQDKWTKHLFEIYISSGIYKHITTPRPNLHRLWSELKARALLEIQSDDIVIWERNRWINGFSGLANLVEQSGLGEIQNKSADLAEISSAWLAAIEQEEMSDYFEDEWDAEKREEISKEYEKLATALKTLSTALDEDNLKERVQSGSRFFERKGEKLLEHETEYERNHDVPADVEREVTIEDLFKDL